MRKVVLISILSIAASISWGQLSLDFDTLTYYDRFQGRLDSIDMNGCSVGSTFDGGLNLLSSSELSVGGLFRAYTEPVLNNRQPFAQMEFSALPHLGFSYSIGGQTSQFLQAKYNHAFSDRTLLDLRYSRRSGDGIIRNSGFKKNDLRVQFQHVGKIYSTALKARYLSNTLSHSWGLASDSLVGIFDLDFIPVVSSSANSTYKSTSIEWSNYFDVWKDSSFAFGPMIYSQYGVYNRVYNQSGDLGSLYDQINIDSLSTRDQLNIANIQNGVGLFLKSQSIFVGLHADYNYWKYQNLGVNRDSTEVFVKANAGYARKKLHVQDGFSFNVIGRYGELENRLMAQYQLKRLQLNGNLDYMQKAPSYEQRVYFANGLSYQMHNIALQKLIYGSIGGSADFSKGKYSMSVRGQFASVDNLYAFNGQEWVSDSVRSTMVGCEIAASLKFSVFHIQPRFILSHDSQGYLPLFSAATRMFVKGKLFKAKKLEALIGVDYSFIDQHKQRAYLPMLDSYNWMNTSALFNATSNLHAFVSLGIAEFRFYIRYENLGAFWWDERNATIEGYPMASTRLRLGLTWDFFN